MPCENCDQIDRRLERIELVLEGDGTPGEGVATKVALIEQMLVDIHTLPIRVDRLEQSEDRRRWGFRAAVTVALSALATAMMALFKKP